MILKAALTWSGLRARVVDVGNVDFELAARAAAWATNTDVLELEESAVADASCDLPSDHIASLEFAAVAAFDCCRIERADADRGRTGDRVSNKNMQAQTWRIAQQDWHQGRDLQLIERSAIYAPEHLPSRIARHLVQVLIGRDLLRVRNHIHDFTLRISNAAAMGTDPMFAVAGFPFTYLGSGLNYYAAGRIS